MESSMVEGTAASSLPEDSSLSSKEAESVRLPLAWPGAADSLSHSQAMQVAPAVLAYIGDGLYELHVRLLHLHPPRRIQAYHQQVVAQVRAETQAKRLEQLSEQLTEAERDIVRRGRNAATGRPRRLSQETYRQATGFEALLGYLYLTDSDRLTTLLAQLDLLEQL